ncbi:MAG: transcriptional regulator [Armatimonadetes bacterium RBG_16_58_9]|nr:MAG: transcriptional regulator [Armatimonadetes bacterium RBG_16_58_9]
MMTDARIGIIRALRDGIPLSDTPFEEVARQAGISLDDLLRQLRQWQSDGTIRRFGAILRHHQAGYEANAMVVWDVPDDRIEHFAEAAVSFRNVSHCYQRPRFAGLPYNLYTMIHGLSRDDCEAVARSIADKSDIREYALLYTTAEFKKSSPVYFPSEELDD